jgi:hypothetical protein
MKTAMQEFIEYLEKAYYINELTNFDKDKIKFLKKEKEQIIEAINAWCSDDNILTPEQYYNQTYNQNKS